LLYAFSAFIMMGVQPFAILFQEGSNGLRNRSWQGPSKRYAFCIASSVKSSFNMGQLFSAFFS